MSRLHEEVSPLLCAVRPTLWRCCGTWGSVPSAALPSRAEPPVSTTTVAIPLLLSRASALVFSPYSSKSVLDTLLS